MTIKKFPQPLTRIHPPKKVLIVGAGLAGLTAAFELNQAGREVLVPEARTRPGGRFIPCMKDLAMVFMRKREQNIFIQPVLISPTLHATIQGAIYYSGLRSAREKNEFQ